MAYSESLADRIRQALSGRKGMAEKKMFGGLGFLLNGNMCVGVWKTSLIVRIDSETYESALRQPHAAEFDITGRPMRGWIMVADEGLKRDAQLARWIEQAVAFVSRLPPKKAAANARTARTRGKPGR